MKSLKKTPLALALAALFASPFALANDTNGGYDNATLYTDVYLHNQIYVDGYVNVYGDIEVASESWAVIDSEQKTFYNQVYNQATDNNARMQDDALRDAEGNIGVNIGAGDNNQQANDVALSVVDADFVFANAQVFNKQTGIANLTSNFGTQNNARLQDNAMENAEGNIGVNIAAGAGNQQQNNLAVSLNTSGTIAKATVSGSQKSLFNYTLNDAIEEAVPITITLSGTASGTYEGQSDQIGDVYLDTWSFNPDLAAENQHPCGCAQTGHVDVDSDAQGATDLNDDGGAFAFNESGDVELGTISLTGTILQTIYAPVVNDARVQGDALRNATGNIGVNVAAGSGNMQRNSLAVAVAFGGGGTPPGNGE